MGQTKNFFKEKKSWSVVKDRILDYYLKPYTSKVLSMGKPIVICDCFAGKGKFEDGEKGSPLIIAEHIKNVILKNPLSNSKIRSIFVEKKYHAELETNLAGYANVKVHPGSFEDNLQAILALDKNNNVFLYVDPYGIKSLNLALFDQIKGNQFFSLEMLMNFNSTGFLREGCRLLKYEGLIEDDDVTDYEVDDEISMHDVDNMSAVAGGDYWKGILSEHHNGRISFHEAEEKFFSEYSRTVSQLFKYTVNIPIKIKSTHLPKYRLIFASNHEDGLILMADNMNKKWNEIMENQRGGQQVLFDFEFPDLTLLKGFDLHEDILSFVSARSSGIPLKTLIVELIQKYGITFSESKYKNQILGMEKDSALIIDRVPALTPTGKPATSMDYGEYKITIRKKA